MAGFEVITEADHLKNNGLRQTDFAIQANTTDRTIRSFMKTGNVRKGIFEDIAKAMGVSRSDLLKP